MSMKSTGITFLFGVILFVVSGCEQKHQPQVKQEEASDKDVLYACPPCGCAGDSLFQHEPGFCFDCGAALYPIVEGMNNQDLNSNSVRKKVAILVFPYAEVIDFSGPWEVLAAAGMEVWSVAKTEAGITCTPGMKIVPDYTFANSPIPDILLVPGGGVDPGDSITVNWIKSMSKQTEHVVSVCTGAYLLGAAGLLKNDTATTFYMAIDDFRKKYPDINVVDNQRFVDNGKVITSAGLSSGIDAAFYVISLYEGNAKAKQVANLLEYNWQPDHQYVRGNLADKHLIGFMTLFTPFKYTLINYQGNENEWNIRIQLETNLKQVDIEKLLNTQATRMKPWKAVPNKLNEWSFKDGKNIWYCNAELKKTKIGFEVGLNSRLNNRK